MSEISSNVAPTVSAQLRKTERACFVRAGPQVPGREEVDAGADEVHAVVVEAGRVRRRPVDSPLEVAERADPPFGVVAQQDRDSGVLVAKGDASEGHGVELVVAVAGEQLADERVVQ